MTIPKFRKRLSANDVGSTGGHQGGILIPKGEKELLEMLPPLNPNVKNPDAWIECRDEAAHSLKFRFVYYNNKLHDDGGTRDEYRLTHMTGWFRDVGAKEGDEFEIFHEAGADVYSIGIRSKDVVDNDPQQVTRIRLTGWRRIH